MNAIAIAQKLSLKIIPFKNDDGTTDESKVTVRGSKLNIAILLAMTGLQPVSLVAGRVYNYATFDKAQFEAAQGNDIKVLDFTDSPAKVKAKAEHAKWLESHASGPDGEDGEGEDGEEDDS